MKLLPNPEPHTVGATVCVVTCHNYGRFLRPCLDSLLQQTRKFRAIILVDDSSDDETPTVAEDYAGVVTYVRGEWKDFNTARMEGLKHGPRSPFILFVDADNYLAPDFHELLHAAMTSTRIAVTYATVQVVDQYGRNVHLLTVPYNYDQLRRNNFADACSLIRRDAFEQVSGWEMAKGGLSDWLLWLKITRNGWQMKNVPEAKLFYRVHGNNMLAGKHPDHHLTYNVDVWKKGCIITIVTLFSGRSWQLVRYIEAVKALDWPKEGLRLVAVDNSRNRIFTNLLITALNEIGVIWTRVQCDDVVIPTLPASSLADSAELRCANAYAINVHLARMYSLAAQTIPRGTDAVFCLEDDIEPPPDVLSTFVTGLYTHPEAGVISGVVRERFLTERLLAWRGRWNNDEDGFSLLNGNNTFGHLTVPPAKGTYEQITASGFMCTFFRREVWDGISFRPAPIFDSPHCYYDWAAAHSIEQNGWQWFLAGGVRCAHWQVDGTCLEVLDPGESPKYPTRTRLPREGYSC